MSPSLIASFIPAARARARVTAPAAPPPAPAPAPAPDEGEGVSRRTIAILTAVGGGLLAASLFLAAALPAGGPFLTVIVFGFGGGIVMFVGSILGAMSRRYSSGARVGFGIGAALAFILAFFVLVIGPAAAMSSAPVCGVVGAAPGLVALRSFTLLRDAGV